MTLFSSRIIWVFDNAANSEVFLFIVPVRRWKIEFVLEGGTVIHERRPFFSSRIRVFDNAAYSEVILLIDEVRDDKIELVELGHSYPWA